MPFTKTTVPVSPRRAGIPLSRALDGKLTDRFDAVPVNSLHAEALPEFPPCIELRAKRK